MKAKSLISVLTGLVLSCSLLLAGPAMAERGHGKRGFNPEKMMEKISAKKRDLFGFSLLSPNAH